MVCRAISPWRKEHSDSTIGARKAPAKGAFVGYSFYSPRTHEYIDLQFLTLGVDLSLGGGQKDRQKGS